MTLDEFSDIFAPLAIQLRNMDADAVTIGAYYEALKGVDIELVQMAAQELAKGKWFPKTSEWLEEAARIEVRRINELYARIKRLPSPLCNACDDTGWERRPKGVKPCSCRRLRRLEVLGRRPMPALPEAAPEAGSASLILAAVKRLSAKKGMA